MKTFTSLENINSEHKYLSLAIGNFDGVHLGHQTLLNETVKDAHDNQGTAAVFTFWPHPLNTLNPDIPLKLLSAFERKKQLIAETGIDKAFFVPFTKEIMQLTPEEFVKAILIDRLKVSSIHVGYNFSFGKNAAGTTEDLKNYGEKYGFKVFILSEVNIDGNTVSSTFIRQCIEDGEMVIANKLLGYTYNLEGKVVPGEQRGRTIGFPTANLEVCSEVIIPARGVYAAYVIYEGKQYKAVLNIGNKPTFGNYTQVSLEAHLLDFSEDLYGKNIILEFVERLRGEEKFASAQELIAQINKDVKAAKEIL